MIFDLIAEIYRAHRARTWCQYWQGKRRDCPVCSGQSEHYVRATGIDKPLRERNANVRRHFKGAQ